MDRAVKAVRGLLEEYAVNPNSPPVTLEDGRVSVRVGEVSAASYQISCDQILVDGQPQEQVYQVKRDSQEAPLMSFELRGSGYQEATKVIVPATEELMFTLEQQHIDLDRAKLASATNVYELPKFAVERLVAYAIDAINSEPGAIDRDLGERSRLSLSNTSRLDPEDDGYLLKVTTEVVDEQWEWQVTSTKRYAGDSKNPLPTYAKALEENGFMESLYEGYDGRWFGRELQERADELAALIHSSIEARHETQTSEQLFRMEASKLNATNQHTGQLIGELPVQQQASCQHAVEVMQQIVSEHGKQLPYEYVAIPELGNAGYVPVVDMTVAGYRISCNQKVVDDKFGGFIYQVQSEHDESVCLAVALPESGDWESARIIEAATPELTSALEQIQIDLDAAKTAQAKTLYDLPQSALAAFQQQMIEELRSGTTFTVNRESDSRVLVYQRSLLVGSSLDDMQPVQRVMAAVQEQDDQGEWETLDLVNYEIDPLRPDLACAQAFKDYGVLEVAFESRLQQRDEVVVVQEGQLIGVAVENAVETDPVQSAYWKVVEQLEDLGAELDLDEGSCKIHLDLERSALRDPDCVMEKLISFRGTEESQSWTADMIVNTGVGSDRTQMFGSSASVSIFLQGVAGRVEALESRWTPEQLQHHYEIDRLLKLEEQVFAGNTDLLEQTQAPQWMIQPDDRVKLEMEMASRGCGLVVKEYGEHNLSIGTERLDGVGQFRLLKGFQSYVDKMVSGLEQKLGLVPVQTVQLESPAQPIVPVQASSAESQPVPSKTPPTNKLDYLSQALTAAVAVQPPVATESKLPSQGTMVIALAAFKLAQQSPGSPESTRLETNRTIMGRSQNGTVYLVDKSLIDRGGLLVLNPAFNPSDPHNAGLKGVVIARKDGVTGEVQDRIAQANQVLPRNLQLDFAGAYQHVSTHKAEIAQQLKLKQKSGASRD